VLVMLLKALPSAAVWININNDCGNGRDRRDRGIDQQFALKGVHDVTAGDGVTMLDALPHPESQITREEAAKYFADKHGVVLRQPVTVIAIGKAFSDYVCKNTLAALEGQTGTVLVTTSPRTWNLDDKLKPLKERADFF